MSFKLPPPVRAGPEAGRSTSPIAVGPANYADAIQSMIDDPSIVLGRQGRGARLLTPSRAPRLRGVKRRIAACWYTRSTKKIQGTSAARAAPVHVNHFFRMSLRASLAASSSAACAESLLPNTSCILSTIIAAAFVLFSPGNAYQATRLLSCRSGTM